MWSAIRVAADSVAAYLAPGDSRFGPEKGAVIASIETSDGVKKDVGLVKVSGQRYFKDADDHRIRTERIALDP